MVVDDLARQGAAGHQQQRYWLSVTGILQFQHQKGGKWKKKSNENPLQGCQKVIIIFVVKSRTWEMHIKCFFIFKYLFTSIIIFLIVLYSTHDDLFLSIEKCLFIGSVLPKSCIFSLLLKTTCLEGSDRFIQDLRYYDSFMFDPG